VAVAGEGAVGTERQSHGQDDVAVRVSADPGGSGTEQMLPVAATGHPCRYNHPADAIGVRRPA